MWTLFVHTHSSPFAGRTRQVKQLPCMMVPAESRFAVHKVWCQESKSDVVHPQKPAYGAINGTAQTDTCSIMLCLLCCAVNRSASPVL
jgi:hypothetical protein